MSEDSSHKAEIVDYIHDVFELSKQTDLNKFNKIVEKNRPYLVDQLEAAIEDLYKIAYPSIETDTPEYVKTLQRYKKRYYQGDPEKCGVWVYYSWRNTL